MRRLRVQVLPVRTWNSPANSLHARPDAIPPFMEPCAEDDSLEDLSHKITDRYSRLYPHRPPLKIERLLDGYDTVLEVGDPDFKVGDAFTDSEKTESLAKFTVKVVQERLRRPAQLPLQRYDSIPPDSSAIPRKRPLGGIGYNARSSMRDFMRPADVEAQERPLGYASSNKRQRIEVQEISRRDDPDRPILSRERDLGEIPSQRSLVDRNESVVRLVQDSQQSPHDTGRNQRSPYERPTSPSARSYTAAVQSARPEFAAVPDSPPTVVRSSIIDGSQPFETLQDGDTKAESPELGQTLHNVPASSFGSPFNGPERAMIDTAEDFLIPPLPPPARRPNGHEYPEHDQYLTQPVPSTPQPLAGPLPRKSSLSKPSPQGTSLKHISRPTEVAYKPVRDTYDPPTTDTENSQGHPSTPKAKRLKTSGALSTHTNGHSDNQSLPQSDLTFVINPDSLSRRGSGITESELNWLRTQEKSICKPSQGNYDFAIDEAITALSAVPDEERMSNGIDERKATEDEAREKSREALEEEDDRKKRERVERERKAEAERVAKENRERTDHARRVEADRVAEENRKHAERERKAKADRIAEERKQAERERKAEADRIAENNRKQAEREREAEELRLSKLKADEAAEALKANEERIAAEAKEKAKQERLERKREKEKAKEVKERKEREKLSAARKEEQRVAKEKEKLVQSEKEAAQKVVAPRRKAKTVAKESGKTQKKTSPQAQAEKDRKANEAFQRARASSVSSQRQSSTSLSISVDTPRDGKKGSSTPLIPGGSRKEPSSSNKIQSSTTPSTNSKGTGLEVQMPLPSALKQSPNTLRRSVSFADNEKTAQPKLNESSSSVTRPESKIPILPQGTTEKDLAIARAISSQPKAGSLKPKTPGKSRSSVKEEASGGKVQSKLNVIRDTKLKGRVIDAPPRPKSPVQDQISISSESERSATPFYSDPEDDPRQNGGARAGPSSRATPSSHPASAKANVTAQMKSVTIPTITTPKPTISKPEPPKNVISDNDSIESFRSESEAGSRLRSASRSPARYVSQTPASRSISTSEIAITSPLPDEPKGSTKNSTIVSYASTPNSHVPQSSGADTEKANPSFQPPSSDRTQSQPSQAPSTQLSLNTSQSSEIVHAQTVERDLEAHLQRDISRSSAQPPSSQPRFQNQDHPSRASAPPKTNPNPKPTQATKQNTMPPTKTPSTASTARTTQPDPRPSTTSRFPSLTGLKKNPPKWDFKDGGAAPMPEFMKPTPKPKATPPSSSQDKIGSLFMSPNSQQKYVDLDRSSDEDDDNDSSSDNDVTIVNGDGHASAKAIVAGRGRPEPNGRTPLTSTATSISTGKARVATGGSGTGSKSKYGSALKRMWPFGSSSQPYEI